MKTLAAVSLLLAALLAADAKNLLKPTNKPESWRFEQHEGGKGGLKAEGDAIAFEVTNVTGTDWHVQAYQVDLDLAEGKEYVVKFQIKASENRSLMVAAGIDQDDWHGIGLNESLFVGKEYKPYEITFRAENVAPKKNRIGFVLGESKGTVFVKDFTLTAK